MLKMNTPELREINLAIRRLEKRLQQVAGAEMHLQIIETIPVSNYKQTAAKIKQAACIVGHINMHELEGDYRETPMPDIRTVAHGILKEIHPELKPAAIAKEFNRDRTSIIFSLNKFNKKIQKSKKLNQLYHQIKNTYQCSTPN